MRNRVVAAVALVLAMATPAYAQSSSELTQDDVNRALEARNSAADSLTVLTEQFEVAVADEAFARSDIADLARAIAALELDIADKEVEVLDLVRNRYMSGGSTGTERLFAATTFDELPVQNEYFDLLSARDHAMLRGLESAEKLHKEHQQALDASLLEQVALVADITDLRDEILATLTDADTAYNAIAADFAAQEERRRIEEEERKRREAEQAAAATSTTTNAPSATTSTTRPPATTTTVAQTTTTSATTTTTTPPPPPPPIVTDGKTCPVNAATSFSDSWGAPRSGGRTHKGVDMMAVRNAPLVAIESGTVTRISNSSLGGRSVYLTGVSGAKYYYAHLESFASGISGGTQVNVGDVVGYNGSSGNAPDYLPHLHFQYAPPGSDWVNPYPLVNELCR